jgi:formylglycine-generating enzyme required for sulfatase activity
MLSLMLPLLSQLAQAEPISIPAGSFEQGSGRSPDEPLRTVQLSAFAIDPAEVSIEEFERFSNEGWPQPEWWSTEGLAWREAHPVGAGVDARAAGRLSSHPVVAVSFWEAEAYCAWRGGSLPTETQWERAACAQGGKRFAWGDDEEVDVVWYSGGKFGHLTDVRTSPVDQSAASTLSEEGLHHTAGNVWEWTLDRYHRDGTSQGDSIDPTGPTEGPWRVLRGGSFMNLPSYCTCTHREPARPDRVAFTTGFRCAYSASSPQP